MRLTQVRDFVAVVESGSIRAAARKLSVSQPAITKSVRGLEGELQVRLLQRSSKGIVPTPSGRAFFVRARVAQSELLKAEDEATQGGGGCGAGSVAFGVDPVAAFSIMPEVVSQFRGEFPKARLRIVEGFTRELLPLVRDETLDLAVGTRSGDKLDPAFTFHPLFRHRFVVVARKGHPLRNARSLAQLDGADWINLAPPGAPGGGPLERAFSLAGLSLPQQAIQCDSYHTAIGMLAGTDMLGIMSRRLIKDSFAREFLRQIDVAEPMPSYTGGMFTRADSPLTPLAAAIAKAVTTAARALARST